MITRTIKPKKLSSIFATGLILVATMFSVCNNSLPNAQAQSTIDVTRAAGSFRIEPNRHIFFYPANGGNPVRVYDGTQQTLAIVQYNGAIYTAFENGGIYRSPDGQNLGGGGRTTRLYSGQKVVAMLVCRGGLYTAFDGAGIYYSPDGQNPGGGGRTTRVYDGTQLVTKMLCDQGSGINGTDSVITTFSGAGVYKSPDGNNLGGGGNTRKLN
ncbi:hypothetical protein NIES2119_26930 [[Phormidium ambiguum] IAM M-71]|uniref:Uncharacterized protein n=2 Tax=[Phormidium ambiguum] IAM M-71 TaxID=454136 RepID=A0A1U7I730_9CYAN|nr:hypothetical protein NIES2119_26930 [Phormidium ambiguum IAM M-71]